MKFAAITFLFTSITWGLFAQDFEVPRNYKLEKPEDYARYEQDVLKGYEWLMNTPHHQQADKRKSVNAFLLTWMSGSPDVHLEIQPAIVTFVETSPDLLMMFLGGWTKYALESRDFDNKVAGSLAGIESVIAYYSKNKGSMAKDKNVEKYLKMKSKGKLKDYIEKNA